MKKLVAAGLLTAVTVPATLLVATPANADIERTARCGAATYELNVDRERGGFDVDADLEDARPGSTWRVLMKHDGKTFYNKVRTADDEGEISVDRWRANTAGKDAFVVEVRKSGSTTTCTSKIVTR